MRLLALLLLAAPLSAQVDTATVILLDADTVAVDVRIGVEIGTEGLEAAAMSQAEAFDRAGESIAAAIAAEEPCNTCGRSGWSKAERAGYFLLATLVVYELRRWARRDQPEPGDTNVDVDVEIEVDATHEETKRRPHDDDPHR